ncbi:MAG: GTP 3',8-cyclase MoaA [Deltaproteobacteria bacterium]|nr:GTP 3',8-cyclase MoaA [Deltaproteobacteria bacterium]
MTAAGSQGVRCRFDRAINYLRISVTDRCNLRCVYCMPETGVRKLSHDEILRLEEIVEVAREAAALGLTKIRVTGGEPLVRRDVTALVNDLASLPGVETVAMTTNGLLLPAMAFGLKAAGLKRVNISLDSLAPGLYRASTRGGDVTLVLAGIEAALAAGFEVKVNAVLLETTAPSIAGFLKFSRDAGVEVRFIERMNFEKGTVRFSEEDALALLCLDSPLTPLPRDPASPHVRRFACGGARLGFISPLSHPFCAACNRLRLTSEGTLRSCLASKNGVDVRTVLRRPHTAREVAAAILDAVAEKPAMAKWGEQAQMWRMGG